MKWKLFARAPSLKPRTNVSLFDDLSNELDLEIFDYLSFNEILHSLTNLNIRLNELIDHYPFHLNLQSSNRVPRSIRSLKFTGTYQLPLFYSLSADHFSSLRAITFGNVRARDILYLLDTLPLKQLEYIYLGVCAIDRTEDERKLLSSVQTRILSLSEFRLKHCRFNDLFSVVIDHLPTKLFALESLQINACQDFLIVSSLIVRTFKLDFLCVSIREEITEPLTCHPSSLTSLRLSPYSQCTIEQLDEFLTKMCPHLQRLVVQLYIHRRELPKLLVNQHQWLTIFPSQLRTFHLKCIPNVALHFTPTKIDPPTSALKQLVFIPSNSDSRHSCQVIIDPPFIKAWNTNSLH